MSVNNRLYLLPPELRAHIYEHLPPPEIIRNADREAANIALANLYQNVKKMPAPSFLGCIAKKVDRLPTSDEVKMKRVLARAYPILEDYQTILPPENQDNVKTLSLREINQRASLIADKQAANLIEFFEPLVEQFEALQPFWASIASLPVRERASQLRNWLKENGGILLDHWGVLPHYMPFELYPIFFQLAPTQAKPEILRSARYQIDRTNLDGRLFRFLLGNGDSKGLSHLLCITLRKEKPLLTKQILQKKSFSLQTFIQDSPIDVPDLAAVSQQLCPRIHRALAEYLADTKQKYKSALDCLTKRDFAVLFKTASNRTIPFSNTGPGRGSFKFIFLLNRCLARKGVEAITSTTTEETLKLRMLVGARMLAELTPEEKRSFGQVYTEEEKEYDDVPIGARSSLIDTIDTDAVFTFRLPNDNGRPLPLSPPTLRTRSGNAICKTIRTLADQLCRRQNSGKTTINWDPPPPINRRSLHDFERLIALHEEVDHALAVQEFLIRRFMDRGTEVLNE